MSDGLALFLTFTGLQNLTNILVLPKKSYKYDVLPSIQSHNSIVILENSIDLLEAVNETLAQSVHCDSVLYGNFDCNFFLAYATFCVMSWE